MISKKRLFINLSFCYLCIKYNNLKRKHRLRRWNVRPINKDWFKGGYHRKVFLNIKSKDEEQFFLHTRMSRKLFDLLLELLGSSLIKPKQRINTEERLSITLLCLAHGVSMQSIAWSSKLGKSTVRKIILETCDTLWRLLSPIYLSEPTTKQYEDIENDFYQMWNMPNCVGAIDGKHIAIKCPPNSNSMYFNYKKFFSIVLMAVCDAKYTFTAISVGSYGSQSDGGIFRLSPFGEAIMNGKIAIPPSKVLPQSSDIYFPHFFIGDAAFPLRPNLMRPYAGSNLERRKNIFNYRLSRARRVIENSFGILSARWRILLTTIEASPDVCEKVVLACILLHNFIMLNDQQKWYCPNNFIDREGQDGNWQDGEWRSLVGVRGNEPLRSIRPSHSRRSTDNAIQLREKLSNYFMNEGSILYQNRITLCFANTIRIRGRCFIKKSFVSKLQRIV